MIFTLTYDGPLSASKSGSSAKHEIRRELHPQIKALWELPPLNNRQGAIDARATRNSDGDGTLLHTVGNRSFATLVSDKYYLRAKLHILVLRRDPPGNVLMHGGDIDNRLKTLFDALRRPQQAQEIPSAWEPSADENPLHCLLDDDRLVTRVDVDTAQWLVPGDSGNVRLIINVEVWTPSPTYWSLGVVN